MPNAHQRRRHHQEALNVLAAKVRATATRPITIDRSEPSRHVVHGVHGRVSVNAITHAYATFTWAEAQPDTVRIDFTVTATGAGTYLLLQRDLLHRGGKPGNVKVDHACDLSFVEITGTKRSAWAAFDQRWLRRFLDTTYAITAEVADERGEDCG